MKRYAILLVSGIFITLAAVALFNWLIDPYDILRSYDIAGLNRYKSEVESHTRLTKAYGVEETRPEAILLASSRGLVIPDDYFSGENLRGYNLSIASSTTYELLRMLQHAQAVSPLKRVVLGIDEDFIGGSRPNFSEARLAVDANGNTNYRKWMQRLVDNANSLFSVSALRSSIRTIRMQEYDPETIGLETYNADRIARAGGHRQMFRNMEASIFYDYRGQVGSCNNPQAEADQVPEAVKYFERMIDIAYQNNIDLYLYFSPLHARLYEVNCMTGKGAHIENIKRAVVTIVKNKAQEYDKVAYPFWDFSGFNSITNELLPVSGDTSSVMKWYWEGSHYTKETARLIFNRIYDVGEVPEDFGRRVTADNIEQHLAQIRDQHQQYIKTHGGDITELQALFDEVTQRHAAD